MRIKGLLKIILMFLLSFYLCDCGPKVKETHVLVWPPPPDKPRIQYLKSYSTSRDFGISTGEKILEKLAGPKTFFRLNKPADIAVDSGGRIFVTDTSLGCVVVFDEKEKKVWKFGDSGVYKLQSPTGIAIDSKDRVYVSDSQQNIVFIYNNKGMLIGHLGGKDIFNRPSGIAIDEDRERIYVSNTRNHRIDVFDLKGEYLYKIGEVGIDPRGENIKESAGKFFFPTYLALDKEGNLYVVDTMNCRVQILDPRGKVQKIIGSCGNKPRQFARPKGIALDNENHIYVIDSAFNNIQIFDRDGRLLLVLGGSGHQPGYFDLPAGIYIDNDDKIYVVADTFHIPHIQIFQYLGEKSK